MRNHIIYITQPRILALMGVVCPVALGSGIGVADARRALRKRRP